MIHTIHRSDRLLLAVAFACFAIAGLATGTAALGVTVAATGLAVCGAYCLARYASSVTRRTLANLALALWIGFLGVAGLHAIGLTTVAGAVPGSTTTLVGSLTAITWATFLTASGTTAFLGFREYGAGAPAPDDHEQVLESETSDYSTR